MNPAPPSPPGAHPYPARRPRPIDTSLVMPNALARRIYRFVQPAVEGCLGFPDLWSVYDETVISKSTGSAFAAAFMSRLGVRWAISPEDLATLRDISGPAVIVSNHPFGGIDSLTLLQLLETIRPGAWRMLSNRVICAVPELSAHAIAVDPIGRSAESMQLNRRGLGQALGHLRAGGILAMFPAGRVSHWDGEMGAVTDRPWSDHAVRLAEKSGASIACLHIPGHNSRRFLRIPPAWSRLRALALCRELVHPGTDHLEIRLAANLSPGMVRRLAAMSGPGERLRAECYLRSDRDLARNVRVRSPADRVAVIDSGPRARLQTAVGNLAPTARLLSSSDGSVDVLLFRGSDCPELLQELGRCREITFRAAGQGVGRDRDLAPEDDYYHHLVLWHRARQEIVGAYRLGFVQEIIASHGPAGLYLDHVFSIRPDFYRRLGSAVELSRSFVMPQHQRDNQALSLLWQGLGAAATRHGCTCFFGSVTISNDHHPATRSILVDYLRRHHADTSSLSQLVRARNPFRPVTRYHSMVAKAWTGQSIDVLEPLVDKIERGERGIPPLMRYYCSLGAKFLAYHVEPTFGDALYCLLRVDLAAIPDRYRRRFLKTEAELPPSPPLPATSVVAQ
jgi:putative hemolysin